MTKEFDAKRTIRLVDFLGPVGVFGLFVGLWYLAAYQLVPHNFAPNGTIILVPPPHRLWEDMGNQWPVIWRATLLTAKVSLLGLSLAFVIGVISAVTMSQARWIEKSFYPYLIALQAVPILAITPLIGNTFGTNFRSRILVTIIIAIFPIVSNTLFGLTSVEQNQHDLLTLNGAGRFKRLFKLQFPAAMPSIFTGLGISAGLSVIGAVVADFFFNRGDPGIGYRIVLYSRELKPGRMFVSSIMAIILGISIFVFFEFLKKRVVGHWHTATRTNN